MQRRDQYMNIYWLIQILTDKILHFFSSMLRGLEIEHLLLYLFVMAFKTRPNFLQHCNVNISYVHIFKREFHLNTVFKLFLSLFTPNSSHVPPQINDLFFCSCTLTHIYTNHLLSPFDVANMYICLGITMLDWITYLGTSP